jgi:hypothetical protein
MTVHTTGASTAADTLSAVFYDNIAPDSVGTTAVNNGLFGFNNGTIHNWVYAAILRFTQRLGASALIIWCTISECFNTATINSRP